MGKDICKSTEEDCGERDARNPKVYSLVAGTCFWAYMYYDLFHKKA